MKKLLRNKTYKLLVPMVFIFMMMASSFWSINSPSSNSTPLQVSKQEQGSPAASADSYQSPIIGTGLNRTTRIYLSNTSSAIGTDSFNISSSSDSEYITEGQFNITLEKSYNTTYVLEDDTPLEYPKASYSSPYLNTNLQTGSLISGNLADVDDDNDLFAEINSSSQSLIINITTDFSSSTIPINDILGFKVSIRLSLTEGADITLKGYNNQASSWNDMDSDNIPVSTNEIYNYYVPNKNLAFVNTTNNASFSFVFENTSISSEFTLRLYYVQIVALQGQETPIDNDQSVALEFNTLGNCTVYGFQAWIRSFNTTTANETSNLTIKLYHTNRTVPLMRSELLEPNTVKAEPDETGTLLAENSYLNFTGDDLIWFNFTSNYSGIELNVSDFFIVVSSNTTRSDGGKTFSIVSIPYTGAVGTFDKDNRIDHLLLTNSTGSWDLVKLTNYQYQCDAAGFTLNLTRAYLPSEIELNIQDHYVSNSYIQDYPHDEVNPLYATPWWGYGTIYHHFDPIIKAENGNFTIDWSWNTTTTPSISFGVNYDVIKYLTENATTEFVLQTDEDPQWTVNLTLDRSKYTNWIFKEMWYLIPTDWTVTNLYAKGLDYLSNTTFENYVDENQNALIVQNDTVVGLPENGDTTYSLIATSVNYTKACILQLQYEDNYWDTNGFMPGDNVSVKLGVTDSDGKYVSGGNATVMLYKPGDVRDTYYTLNDNSIDVNSTYSEYGFDNKLIYASNDSVDTGTYYVKAYWTNGEQAGLFIRPFYIGSFDANVYQIVYNQEAGTNQIWGQVQTVESDISSYNLYTYAIKPVSELSDESDLAINRTIDFPLNQNVSITQFYQNESVLNSGEKIQFQITLKNYHELINFDLKVEVQLISAINEDWILSNSTSTLQTLSVAGDPNGNDEKTYILELNIPTVAEGGVNCPVRNVPYKPKVVVYSDDLKMAEITQNNLLLYTEESENTFEGKILSVVESSDRVGPSFISSFNRSLLELPTNVTYAIQIANSYYMAIDSLPLHQEFSQINATLQDFGATQTNINRSSIVNIVGHAIDESGDNVSSTTMILSYKYNNTWKPLETINGATIAKTNSTGWFDVKVNMSQLPEELRNVEIRAAFLGNSTTMSFEGKTTIALNTFNNSIRIDYDLPKLIVGYENILNVKITNIGNATLEDFKLTVTQSDFSATIIVPSSEIILSPGDVAIFQILLKSDKYSSETANLSFLVEYASIQDSISLNKTEIQTFSVFRANEVSLFKTFSLTFFFIAVAGIWIYAVVYGKKVMKQLNEVPEPSKDKVKSSGRRRTGKYVKIAELARKDREKETNTDSSLAPGDETKQDNQIKKKEGTSLDDLLSEEDI